MKNLPVYWHEGLFLRPQHLQSMERWQSERDATQLSWTHPYGYGLHAINISMEALANHQLEIRSLQARMRDGTLVDFSSGTQLDRVDLKPHTDSANHIQVYLAVPRLNLGQPNTADGADADDLRFTAVQQEVFDENRASAPQALHFRSLNAKILLSSQDTSGYEILPIAQLRSASEGAARPSIDVDYIPPCLSIDAWPELGRGIVRAIFDIIGQKIDVLSKQINSRSVSRDTREPGDADRIAMLERLNEAHAVLSVQSFASGVHPFVAYCELCRLVGSLAIFTDEKCITDIPAYDHEDLARIFNYLQIKINSILNSVQDFKFEQRYFEGVGMGMQVSLEPRWFNSDWQWFIGVAKGDLTQQECEDLLSQGHLDWKLGSSRQVEILFKRRAEGLKLRPLMRNIRALPTQQDWLYYEVIQDSSPAWRDVQQTQSVAIRFKDSLIMNLEKLQGERQIVVSALGRRVPLQFALFAVPQDS